MSQLIGPLWYQLYLQCETETTRPTGLPQGLCFLTLPPSASLAVSGTYVAILRKRSITSHVFIMVGTGSENYELTTCCRNLFLAHTGTLYNTFKHIACLEMLCDKLLSMVQVRVLHDTSSLLDVSGQGNAVERQSKDDWVFSVVQDDIFSFLEHCSMRTEDDLTEMIDEDISVAV